MFDSVVGFATDFANWAVGNVSNRNHCYSIYIELLAAEERDWKMSTTLCHICQPVQ